MAMYLHIRVTTLIFFIKTLRTVSQKTKPIFIQQTLNYTTTQSSLTPDSSIQKTWPHQQKGSSCSEWTRTERPLIGG